MITEITPEEVQAFIPDGAELEVSLVPTHDVHRVWAQVAPMLEKATAMSEGRYNISDLARKLASGEFHLWIIFERRGEIIAAITSTFTWYPQSKALSGQFLGGARLSEWRDKFCNLFDSWGADNGCQIVEFTGRPGWARALKDNGYREIYRTYQRDLR